MIIKEFIDIHEGRIEIDSELGEGSRFEVVLPLNQESSTR